MKSLLRNSLIYATSEVKVKCTTFAFKVYVNSVSQLFYSYFCTVDHDLPLLYEKRRQRTKVDICLTFAWRFHQASKYYNQIYLAWTRISVAKLRFVRETPNMSSKFLQDYLSNVTTIFSTKNYLIEINFRADLFSRTGIVTVFLSGFIFVHEEIFIKLFNIIFWSIFGTGPLQKRVNAPNLGAILKKNKFGIWFHIKF